MKKLMSLLLAMMMLLCAAGCGTSEKETNIYTEITGIAADETVMTVGEVEIPAELFFYWVSTIAREAESYYSQYYMYTGQYGHMLNADLTLNWNASYMQGLTMGDVIRAQAMEQLAFFVIVESLAATHGIELTDADRTEIVASIEANLDKYTANLIEEDPANEALTREEVEEMYFYKLGLSRAAVERLLTVTSLRDAIVEEMMREGSNLFITEEGYNDLGFYADHILIAMVDLDSGMSLSSEKIEEKTKLAEMILTRLQASEDPVTLFAELADMYSEDTGRKTNPTGYIFTPGTMVTEFEDAVAALEVGQISGLVKSTYGYHIILRRDLMEGLEAYPDQKAMLAETYLTTMVNSLIANSSVSTTEALTGIDLNQVYNTYMIKTGQRNTSGTDVTPTDK